MVTLTTTTILDDLDGSQNAQTTLLSFQGVDYELDLCESNLETLTKTLDPYLEVARRRTSPTSSVTTDLDSDNGAIREWARGEGIRISSRGRLSHSVIQQYRAAHQLG